VTFARLGRPARPAVPCKILATVGLAGAGAPTLSQTSGIHEDSRPKPERASRAARRPAPAENNVITVDFATARWIDHGLA